MNTLQNSFPPEFIPWDIQIARINFSANCGPSSFAAIAKKEVCRVMQYFLHFEHFQGTNLTQMRAAFKEAGYHTDVKREIFPEHGVALIQLLGPWTQKHFFSRWSLTQTHWVAVHQGWIFDHIAATWMTKPEWNQDVARELVADVPHATGWAVKYGVEVNQFNSH